MSWKRAIRRVLIGVTLSIGCTTVWLVAQREYRRMVGERELSAAIAEAEQSDPEWTWERLNAARPKPPAGHNGADVIPRVYDRMPPEWVRDVNPEPWEPDATAVPPNVRYPDRVSRLARANVTRAADALAVARTLKDCPFGHRDLALTPDVLSTSLRDTSHTRPVALLLKWDAVLAAENGEAARVTDALLSGLNASRSLGDEPILISQMIRIALRTLALRSLEQVLAQVELSDAQLSTLQRAWAVDAEEPLLLYGVRGERSAYETMLKNLADRTVTPGNSNGIRERGISFETYSWWLYRVRFLNDRAQYIHYMTQAVAAAKLPPHEQLARIRSIPFPPADETTQVVQLVLPAVEQCAVAALGGMAEARCAVVGIGCERFRQKNDRWPNDLAELTPAFLSAVPLDPFDGQPLRFKKMDDGVVVYSVGKRQPDQFGKPPPPPRPGLPEGIEFGFRLWNPDRRRLPPPPELVPAPHEAEQP